MVSSPGFVVDHNVCADACVMDGSSSASKAWPADIRRPRLTPGAGARCASELLQVRSALGRSDLQTVAIAGPPIAGSLIEGFLVSTRPANLRVKPGAAGELTVKSYQLPLSGNAHRCMTSPIDGTDAVHGPLVK